MTITDTTKTEAHSYKPKFTISVMSGMAVLVAETDDTRTSDEIRQETAADFAAIAAWHGKLEEATTTSLTRQEWMDLKVKYWDESSRLRYQAEHRA